MAPASCRQWWRNGHPPPNPAPCPVTLAPILTSFSRSVVGGRCANSLYYAYVRFWLLADIQPHPELRPLYPRKRTFLTTTSIASKMWHRSNKPPYITTGGIIKPLILLSLPVSSFPMSAVCHRICHPRALQNVDRHTWTAPCGMATTGAAGSN